MELSNSSNPVWINYDGALLRAGTPILTPASRAFRYADGLFETMLVKDGQIRLATHHFDRLFSGLHFLGFVPPASFSPKSLQGEIVGLCEKNGHSNSARVRLTAFRGEGGLFDHPDPHPHYTIESSPFPLESAALNARGLVIDLYPNGRKACDQLANLKSNNYLLYTLAALHAQSHHLDECLVLNSYNRLADSTIANLFYIRDRRIFTPPLSEGGVAGVMRRHLLESGRAAGFPIEEVPVTLEDLLNADEVFLTNALRGIRWVASLRETRYTNCLTQDIYKRIFE
jgi:branched-chain amino acid aminotransferase